MNADFLIADVLKNSISLINGPILRHNMQYCAKKFCIIQKIRKIKNTFQEAIFAEKMGITDFFKFCAMLEYAWCCNIMQRKKKWGNRASF